LYTTGLPYINFSSLYCINYEPISSKLRSKLNYYQLCFCTHCRATCLSSLPYLPGHRTLLDKGKLLPDY